ILGADALLLCLSSPFKIESSGFVSSLSPSDERMGFCISKVLAAIYCITDMSQFIGMRSLTALLQRQSIWRQLLLMNWLLLVDYL
ncbi:hypothetical protein, partial [Yersinia pestis]